MDPISNLTTYSSVHLALFRIFFPITVVVPTVGVPANIYILWILLRKQGICSNSDIFTVNLAFLDALCCLLQPMEIAHAITAQPERPVFYSVLLNLFAGPLFQMCTCVDCYIGVIHPIVFLRFKMPRFRLLPCAAVWAATVSLSVSSLFTDNSPKTLESMAGFLIGELGIMVFCNIKILWALKQHRPGCQQLHPAKVRAFRTVLTLLIMVLVHYVTPVANFLVISYNNMDKLSLFPVIAFMLSCISSCNHPFFYLVRTGKLPRFFYRKMQAKVREPTADRSLATVQP
ncbi:proteinase-activated receptor 3-like [Astyanax mexicanus]|uniref:Proteinase-activated receptor 3-like n=1 Tax=Astyanax mexicanus TaxID=7994 RepID=A0A8T2M382_ASTMX|nr:proteinase-activated receptor 3-like [Astyanax mexicanus]